RLRGGHDRPRRAGRAVGLPRNRDRAPRARGDHPPSRRAHRGPPVRARGARAAQEAPGLVLGRPAGLGRPPPATLRRAHGGRGPRPLLGDVVSGPRWFDDFKVGERFESPSKTLTDAHFMFFAGMSGDAHPLHYDDEYAKQTRFGRRLAHGLLLTSLTAVGASTLSPVIEGSIVAFVEQATRFKHPAFVGDTVKPRHEVTVLERKRSAGL